MTRYVHVACAFVLVLPSGASLAAEHPPAIEIQASRELSEEIRAQLDEQEADASQILLSPLDEREVDGDHGELPPTAPEQDEELDDSEQLYDEAVETTDPEELLVDEDEDETDPDPVSDDEVAAPVEDGVSADPDNDGEARDPDGEVEPRDPDEPPAALEDGEDE